MRRPALYALVCLAGGILLGDIFDLLIALLFSLLILTLVFSIIFLIRKETFNISLFLVLALILSGFLRHEILTRQLPANHISNFLSSVSAVTITGEIAAEPDVRKDKTFITVEMKTLSDGYKIHNTCGGAILKVKEPTFRFDYGDKIRLKGYLMEAASRRNPGAFDYQRYLNRRGIFGVVSLSHADQVEVLDRGEAGFYQSQIVIPLRNWIKRVFDKTLSGDHKALLAGFLLGETREISKDVYAIFRNTGTVHLLVVSGSNVWLVVGFILGTLTLLRIPRTAAVLLSLVCILLFANLVNNDPPVVRAGIMAGVVLLGSLIYRDIDLVNIVSFAALLILLFSPLFLFDAGFLLSFASVFGILLLYPKLSQLVSRYIDKSHTRLWHWVIMPALISISVELALFPILAYYFNVVPTIVVLANIFIVPLAGLSVVLTCFTIFSALFSISLAGIFSAANWLCLDLTLRLTEFFATLPATKVTIPTPSMLSFIIYYIFLWVSVGWMGSRRKLILFSFLILLNLFFWTRVFSGEDQKLKITFLDAGSGSTSVIEAPRGRTLLINAGERVKNLDSGEFIVVPFLNHRGITEVDKLILTDTKSPSLGSALSIARDRKVKDLLLSNYANTDYNTIDSLMGMIQNKTLSMDSICAFTGQSDQFTIEFPVYPPAGCLGSSCERNLVKILYGKTSICIFDGMKEVRFTPRFNWEQVKDCSILVLSELGKEDEIRQVISAVRPRQIIFTRHYLRFEKNKIPLLMQRYFPAIEYYRTAQGGAIKCEVHAKGIFIQPTLR
jgi:competence protein ComEC